MRQNAHIDDIDACNMNLINIYKQSLSLWNKHTHTIDNNQPNNRGVALTIFQSMIVFKFVFSNRNQNHATNKQTKIIRPVDGKSIEPTIEKENNM